MVFIWVCYVTMCILSHTDVAIRERHLEKQRLGFGFKWVNA
jgi:hypothetical protein